MQRTTSQLTGSKFEHLKTVYYIRTKHERNSVQVNWLITFFPLMTTPASPWITIYFVPPRYKPVGASVPGSAKSFIIAVISSGLNCKSNQVKNKPYLDKIITAKQQWKLLCWSLMSLRLQVDGRTTYLVGRQSKAMHSTYFRNIQGQFQLYNRFEINEILWSTEPPRQLTKLVNIPVGYMILILEKIVEVNIAW